MITSSTCDQGQSLMADVDSPLPQSRHSLFCVYNREMFLLVPPLVPHVYIYLPTIMSTFLLKF